MIDNKKTSIVRMWMVLCIVLLIAVSIGMLIVAWKYSIDKNYEASLTPNERAAIATQQAEQQAKDQAKSDADAKQWNEMIIQYINYIIRGSPLLVFGTIIGYTTVRLFWAFRRYGI